MPPLNRPQFWSTGNAWGTLAVRQERDTLTAHIHVRNGSLRIGSIQLDSYSGTLENPIILTSGDVVEVRLTAT
jgi:hypothetical protein